MELGPELVALKAWEELRFTPMLEPLSEWALIDWSYRTALPELLDIRITKSAKDRLYRTSDDLKNAFARSKEPSDCGRISINSKTASAATA